MAAVVVGDDEIGVGQSLFDRETGVVIEREERLENVELFFLSEAFAVVLEFDPK